MNPSTDTDPQELNRRCCAAMGWRSIECFTPKYNPFEGCRPKPFWRGIPPGNNGIWQEIVPFASDATAALLLVAELRKAGWQFTITCHVKSGTWSATLEQDEDTFWNAIDQPTFCLAVVLTFLSATEGRV